MVVSENNYSSMRKTDTKVLKTVQIGTVISTSTHRSVASHRYSHLGVGHRTTHHVDRNVARHRHSHVGLLLEYNILSLRGGASKAYVDERVAALLAMVIDLQAQIGGGG